MTIKSPSKAVSQRIKSAQSTISLPFPIKNFNLVLKAHLKYIQIYFMDSLDIKTRIFLSHRKTCGLRTIQKFKMAEVPILWYCMQISLHYCFPPWSSSSVTECRVLFQKASLTWHSIASIKDTSSTDCIWSYFCDPPSPLQECLVRICKYCYYTLPWVSHYLTVLDKFNCRLLRIKYQQNREELKISCHLTSSILETMKAQKGWRLGIKRTLTSVQRQKEQNSSSGERVNMSKILQSSLTVS